jgi:predicted nucleotidyltransferase component of viral defense system
MLDIQTHKKYIIKLFLDILSNENLSVTLGFKGGTALYLFYNLDRFSTDLDFDIIDKDFKPKQMTLEIEKSLEIKEYREKRYTHFWLCSYSKGQHKIKVEVSKREHQNDYEVKDYRGYSCRILTKECMFAHKLCAITERTVLQNRDLYDSWFMFSNNFPVKEEILIERLGKNLSEYSKDLVEVIDNLPKDYNILNGLGSVLDMKRREWVKENLLKELRKYLVSSF